MDKQQIIILSQTVFKGFIEVEKRLPDGDKDDTKDLEMIRRAMLILYKASDDVEKIINELKK